MIGIGQEKQAIQCLSGPMYGRNERKERQRILSLLGRMYDRNGRQERDRDFCAISIR